MSGGLHHLFFVDGDNDDDGKGCADDSRVQHYQDPDWSIRWSDRWLVACRGTLPALDSKNPRSVIRFFDEKLLANQVTWTTSTLSPSVG